MNKLNIKKILLFSVSIVFILLILNYAFFVINGFIPTGNGLNKENWLGFAGSFLGGSIGGIVAIVGVFFTIKSNETITESQIAASASENRELLMEQLKLQHKPILTKPLSFSIDNLSSRNTIIRDLHFSGDIAQNNRYKIAPDDKSMRDIVYPPSTIICLKNNGNGSAYDIHITMKKITSIDGAEDFAYFINNTLPNPYDKCITQEYKLIPDGYDEKNQWLIFTEFSLSKNEEINFVFNFKSNQNEFSMLTIKYKDSYNNQYMQKIMLIYYDNIPRQYPISKVYELK